MGGGEAVSGTGDPATAVLEAWGPGHLTLLHAQEGSQQQRQEDLHSGGMGVWLGSQEAEVSPAPKRRCAGGRALLLPTGSELLALGDSWRPHFVDGGREVPEARPECRRVFLLHSEPTPRSA